jgi:hypothetical protein
VIAAEYVIAADASPDLTLESSRSTVLLQHAKPPLQLCGQKYVPYSLCASAVVARVIVRASRALGCHTAVVPIAHLSHTCHGTGQAVVGFERGTCD